MRYTAYTRGVSGKAVVSFAFAFVLGSPSAEAYLLDANDARTLSPGQLEIELQPAGFYFVVDEQNEYYVLAPSVMLYVGLAPRWDVILLARGYGAFDDELDRYAITDTYLYTRILLREGSYDGDREGPSIALQLGLIAPTWRDEDGVGATSALLVSQEWERLALHANTQVDLRRSHVLGLWATIVLEGPLDWTAHPVVEVWADWEDGVYEVSALAGIVVAPGDRWSFSAGLRASTTGEVEVFEGRFSFWVALNPSDEEVGVGSASWQRPSSARSSAARSPATRSTRTITSSRSWTSTL